MRYLWILLVLPSILFASNPPLPPGYTYDQSVCASPCLSPNWTYYYYPFGNGRTSDTPVVIFKIPDASPTFAVNTRESHTGGGGTLEGVLMLSAMLGRLTWVRRRSRSHP